MKRPISFRLYIIHSKEIKMHCLKLPCTVCLKDREVMTESDAIDGYICTPCVLSAKNKGKVIKIIDGAPRGYVKGTTTPTKQ